MTALERIAAGTRAEGYRVLETRDGAVPTLEVARQDLRETALVLRDRAGFETNVFVTAIDRAPSEPRFELCYQFLSVRHGDRVGLRVRVGEDDARVPSIADLWPGAGYSERECYDMFGIAFEGHAGLRRLLMPEGYEHHPLRKDFPHQGIEPDRLYREWKRERDAQEAGR